MATIVTRAGKGSPLTHNEVDANFENLNTDKYQSGDSPTFNAVTVTGTLALNADPTTSLEAATKQYVDTIAAAGMHYHAPVRVEAPSALTATYSNGSSGVGATLTNSGTQAALVIDGITLSANDRVLVYTQATASENGIYYVSDTGSASTNWVLTRTTDTDSYGASDPDALGQGDAFFVLEGNTGAGELYVMNTQGTITFGTTGITFTQVAATAVYSAGTGLTLTGTEFAAAQDIATSASPTFAGLTVNGSISVTGTVDGRDLATDGTKLDGIEAGATADQSAAEILAAVKTVDGSGSELDADFLDGQEGSYFLNTATTFGGDVSGTYDAIVVADDSHNHIIANVDGLQTELDGKASTSHNHSVGSLSDVTITSNTAGEILKWDGSAWVNNTLAQAGIQPAGSYLTGNQTITLSGDATGSGTTSIAVTVANDSHTHAFDNLTGKTSGTGDYTTTGTMTAATFNATSVTNGGFQGINADTAASPSFTWSSDLDTGMYRTGTNSIGLTTGGTLRLTVNSGGITSSGNVTAYSDERLKSDITTITHAVGKVQQLRGVMFTKDGEASTGVIAQEVQKVLPEVVNDKGEYLSVAYGNMVGLLIEAIKEQQAQIDDLKERLEDTE